MISHAEHEDVTVERRPVLLAHHEEALRCRERVGPAALDEELMVQNSVVFVGHLLVDDVLVLGSRHHHQILEGVVQVAPVVHVDMGGAVVPALGGHVGHALQVEVELGDLSGLDPDFRRRGPELEPLDGGQLHRPNRKLDTEASLGVEDRIPGGTDTRVRVGGRIELAVGRCDVDASARESIGVRLARRCGQDSHRPLPVPLRDPDRPLLAAVRLEKRELRKAAFVRDVGDPLAVGRPAGMEGVVLEERQLVGLSPHRRLHVEVRELIRRSAGRRVDETLSVDRDVGTRAVERLLSQDRSTLGNATRGGRNPQHVAGAERHVPIGQDQKLVAIGKPCRAEMHVPFAEVESAPPECGVLAHRRLFACPLAVCDRSHGDVEVPGGLRRDVGDLGAVGREHRVGVDERVVGEAMALTALHVEDLELDRLTPVVRRVDEPLAVGRPVRGRVIRLVLSQLVCDAAVRIDLPDRAAHGHGNPLAVGRPVRGPRRRARRGREIEVVHVVAAVLRGRVAPGGLGGDRLCDEQNAEGDETSSDHADLLGKTGALALQAGSIVPRQRVARARSAFTAPRTAGQAALCGLTSSKWPAPGTTSTSTRSPARRAADS